MQVWLRRRACRGDRARVQKRPQEHPPPSDDDATEEQPDAYSICLTEAQMNNLWDKLEPGVKAVALDAALNVEV